MKKMSILFILICGLLCLNSCMHFANKDPEYIAETFNRSVIKALGDYGKLLANQEEMQFIMFGSRFGENDFLGYALLYTADKKLLQDEAYTFVQHIAVQLWDFLENCLELKQYNQYVRENKDFTSAKEKSVPDDIGFTIRFIDHDYTHHNLPYIAEARVTKTRVRLYTRGKEDKNYTLVSEGIIEPNVCLKNQINN